LLPGKEQLTEIIELEDRVITVKITSAAVHLLNEKGYDRDSFKFS
jgi:hypothetical protein